MKLQAFPALLLGLYLLGGCERGPLELSEKIPEPARSLLKDHDTFILYSLDPDLTYEEDERAPTKREKYEGWIVLGKTTVKKNDVRDRLVRAFDRGVRRGKYPAKCFEPRHAIKVSKGGRNANIVICFACSNGYLYEQGKRKNSFVVDRSPKPVFNEVLREAGIPLAED